MKLIWLGHASWRIEIEDAVILVDPWLKDNPSFPDTRRDEALDGATHILMTHGHFDHAPEATKIATELDIPVAGIFDLTDYWEASAGVKAIGFNKGGTVDLGGAQVTMVNASHSSSFVGENGVPVYAGHEVGYMIAGEGRVMYFSGDTDIMADMEWMGDLHRPDIGVLSVGGHYTMDPARAAYAARRYFDFKTVICSHYRSFPILAPDTSPLHELSADTIEPEVMAPIEL